PPAHADPDRARLRLRRVHPAPGVLPLPGARHPPGRGGPPLPPGVDHQAALPPQRLGPTAAIAARLAFFALGGHVPPGPLTHRKPSPGTSYVWIAAPRNDVSIPSPDRFHPPPRTTWTTAYGFSTRGSVASTSS